MKSTRTKIFVCLLLLVFCISLLLPLTNVLASSSESSYDSSVLVIYDSTDSTAINAQQMFKQLTGTLDVKSIPVTSGSSLTNLLETIEIALSIVIIGHGNWIGIQIGHDLIQWEIIRELTSEISSDSIVLLSCYSLIVPYGLSEEEQSSGKWFGLDESVDYQIAIPAAVATLAEQLSLPDLENSVNDYMAANWDTLETRMLFPAEPLWASHDQIGQIVYDSYELSYYAKKWLDSKTFYRYGWKSMSYGLKYWQDEADSADGVYALTRDPALFLDAGRRHLWAKHVYGGIGGVEIVLKVWFFGWHEVSLFSLSLEKGWAPKAAEDAYNSAVSKYRYRDLAGSALQLAYAAHYIQDMTQPFHVYDYSYYKINVLNPLSLPSLERIAVDLLRDGLDLALHNNLESWAANNWGLIKNSIKTKAAARSNPYIGDVSSAITTLAKWTRSYVPKTLGEVIGTFPQYFQSTIATLLSKAVDYTAALYNKFYYAVRYI